MFVELIDVLRCPRPHEDTWLVLAARRTEHRHVLEGTLGCPECGAEFQLSGGVADLRLDGVAPLEPAERVVTRVEPTEELTLILAAYAGLTEPGGRVLLGGGLAAVADPLARLTSAVPLVVNPSAEPDPLVSALRCEGRLPVASEVLRAIVLDRTTAAALDVADAVRCLHRSARMVAPAGVPLPPGLRELARDATWWVAEREAPRVTLRRA